MENIVLKVVGTKANAEYNGELTSGSVGIPVVIQYDESWSELSKFASFRVGSFQRTRENVGENTTVPWEVMRHPGKILEIGVEGRDSTGGIVIPTVWASVKTIKQGANKSIPAAAGSPTSGGNSSDGGISVETDPTVPAWAKQPEKPEYTAQEVGAVATVNGIPPDKNGNVKITIPDSSQNVALTTAQINALDGMFKVCAFTKADISAEYTAFKTAFGISDSGGEEEPDEPVTPEKTLTSISATYSGGNVPVGTSVSALTGIVVTAHYSDGSTATVTDYTLSGTIAEGSNTITVGYGGKTTTFTVTGIKATNDTTVVIETYDAGLANGNITTQSARGLGVSKLYGFTTNLTSGYEYLIGSLPYGEETPKSTNCKAALCVDGEFVYAAAMEGTGKPMNPDNTEGQASMNLSTAIFNGVRVVVAYNYADDSYLYIKSTGQVLFAGKNTPYYGMANIDGTPVG